MKEVALLKQTVVGKALIKVSAACGYEDSGAAKVSRSCQTSRRLAVAPGDGLYFAVLAACCAAEKTESGSGLGAGGKRTKQRKIEKSRKMVCSSLRLFF